MVTNGSIGLTLNLISLTLMGLFVLLTDFQILQPVPYVLNNGSSTFITVWQQSQQIQVI